MYVRRCGCKYLPRGDHCKVRVLGDCYSSVITFASRCFISIVQAFKDYFEIWEMGGPGLGIVYFEGQKERKQTTLHTCLSSSCLFIFLLKRTCAYSI